MVKEFFIVFLFRRISKIAYKYLDAKYFLDTKIFFMMAIKNLVFRQRQTSRKVTEQFQSAIHNSLSDFHLGLAWTDGRFPSRCRHSQLSYPAAGTALPNLRGVEPTSAIVCSGAVLSFAKVGLFKRSAEFCKLRVSSIEHFKCFWRHLLPSRKCKPVCRHVQASTDDFVRQQQAVAD